MIQAVVLAELDGLNDPNPYGHTPLTNNHPSTPNHAYFDHVEYVIDKAKSLGMYIALLLIWCNKIF